MNARPRLDRRLLGRCTATAALLMVPLGFVNRITAPVPATHAATDAAGCVLTGAGNNVKHVIYIQFDNTHFMRDNPNVPSDLEQMPHLLSFIENNGTLLTNHHTPLISHTSEDILTSLTGVYPAHHGVAVGQNSYQYYDNSGSPRSYTTAFTYWTDTIGNGTYNMLSGAPSTSPMSGTSVLSTTSTSSAGTTAISGTGTTVMSGTNTSAISSTSTTSSTGMVAISGTGTSPMSGTNAPAPWVPYTRAGCDVGAVSMANMELENANVNSKYGANDIATVFGANSPEAQEPSANRYADFVGIAVHCSQADSADGKMCSSANNGKSDVLPNEPGGYSGFNALYGNKYVAPQVSATGGITVTDTAGNPITNTTTGAAGFPGFDPTAAQSLGYVAAMQEHGIPVTYAYIADAHDQNPEPASGHSAYGPGEQGYVAQLKAYDDAFATFFQRLANDGIDKSNTQFIFTADEGDHFTSSASDNPGCTGATIDNTQNPSVVTPGNYCTYATSRFGEVAVGLDGALAQEQGVTTPQFTAGNDTAPAIYLNGNPGPTEPSVRTFERATGAITVTDPVSNKVQNLTQYLADPTELKLLHMVTADPSRTPTFVLFATPDLYVTGGCGFSYNSSPSDASLCVTQSRAYAWLHGNVQPDITTTWLGLVGPGVQHNGVDASTWSDHTDIRPTMLALAGLQDDYSHDGRILLEDLTPSAVPALQANRDAYIGLAQAYKQINAPVGALGLASLQISTAALESGSASDDSRYMNLESQLSSITDRRDDLASRMATLLDGVTSNGHAFDAGQAQDLAGQGNALLGSVVVLAENTGTSGPVISTSGSVGSGSGATATGTATAGSPTASPTATGTATATASETASATTTATTTGTAAASSATASVTATVSATATGSTTGGTASRLPGYKHVFVIMMENHNYGQIIGNSAAPNINNLAQGYGLATKYYGVTHPSEPNYVASIGGNYFGIQDDAPYYTHTVALPSLASQLEAKGQTWKTYQQSLPYSGYLGTAYPSSSNALYASKHNPFLNFAAIQGSKRELAKIVPWSRLWSDLATGRVPNLSYIVPNQCHDMHGTASCSGDDTALITAGDQTVGTLVQSIRHSPAWRSGNNAIVITWDEDDYAATPAPGCCDANPGGGLVAMIVVTNHGPRGIQDSTPYNHYSLLQTIQRVFRLGCLQFTCDTSSVTPMAPLFAVKGGTGSVSRALVVTGTKQ